MIVLFHFPECPEGPDVLLIVLAVVGGTLGIGLTIWNLYLLHTAVVVRKNFLLGIMIVKSTCMEIVSYRLL